MLHVTVTPPVLVGNETWQETHIVISENPDLSIPLLDVVEANINSATEFTYPIEVVNGTTYYAQAQYTLDPGGLQGPSEITSFVADNSVEFNVELNLPVDIGKIVIDSDYSANEIDHPHMFSNFILIPENDIDIVSTTWVLEDSITHKVLFTSVNDTVNIKKIHLNRFLNPDSLYTIRASITTRAGVKSVFTSFSFKTAPIKDSFMFINGTGLGWFEAISRFELIAPKLYDSLDVELYDDEKIISSFSVPNSPIDLTKKGDFKLGRVRANYSDGTQSTWRYAYSIVPDIGGGDQSAYVYDYPFSYPSKTDYVYIYAYPYPYGWGSLENRCSAI